MFETVRPRSNWAARFFLDSGLIRKAIGLWCTLQ